MKRLFLFIIGVCTLSAASAQGLGTPEFSTPDTQPTAAAETADETLVWVETSIEVTVISVASGDWHNPQTWDCNCVPASTDGVRILLGHEVFLATSAEVTDVQIDTGGSLTLLSASVVSLRIYGDLEAQGMFDASSGVVQFGGGDDHMINGTLNASVLQVVGGTTTIGGQCRIRDEVQLTEATLVTNGALNLVWNGTHMASIGDLTGSTIEGDVRCQNRYQPNTDDWIAVSTMTAGGTLEPFNDEIVTYGFPGSDYPSYGFVSIMHYEEEHATEDISFIAPASVDAATPAGRGYYLYTVAGDYQVESLGPVNQGDVTFDVTYTDHSEPRHDGYNLVGNPYPSALNWDNDGWTRSNVDNALYLWNPETRQYCTYVEGFSLNGGSPIIDAGQAFIVHARDESCGLMVSEPAKTAMLDVDTNTNPDRVHLVISDASGNYDEVILADNGNGTQDFDPYLDALKLMSDTYHNVYAKTGSGYNLGVNQRGFAAGDEMDLYFNTANAGDYTVTVAGAPETDPDWCMALEDLTTGEMHELTAGATFTFNSEVATDQLRFRVHVGQPISVDVTPITCAGMGDAAITVTGNGDGNLTYNWYEGETLTQIYQVAGLPSTVEGLDPGSYTIVVDGNTLCDGLTTTVEIQDQTPIEITAVEIGEVACGENNTGSIAIQAQGGFGPLEYSWSNGLEAPVMGDLMPGFYIVTITDFNGCSIQETYEIEDKVEVYAEIGLAEEVIELVDGQAFVDLANLTTGADTYLWNMGDGTFYSDEAPTHAYTAPGVYDIDLEASNEDCFGMTSVSVIVNESTVGVDELLAGDLADCWMSDDQIHVTFDLGFTQEVTVRVYNQVGQLLVNSGPHAVQNDHLRLDVPGNVHWAVVDVRSLTTSEVQRFKVAP